MSQSCLHALIAPLEHWRLALSDAQRRTRRTEDGSPVPISQET